MLAWVIWQQRAINPSLVCCGCFNSPYVLNENARNSYKICLIARGKWHLTEQGFKGFGENLCAVADDVVRCRFCYWQRTDPLSKKGAILLEPKHHGSHQLREDTVKDNIVLYLFKYNQQDATLHSGICYYKCSTGFRRFLRPSSGAQNCIHSIGYL